MAQPGIDRSPAIWRSGRLAIGAGVVAALLSGALAGAAWSQASHPADPDYPPPYDTSKADRALKAFDEGHPKCALWTDWHKLCSRTGPDGSTYCRTDPEHPAKPSTPFCAANSKYVSDDALSRDEIISMRRFSRQTKYSSCKDGSELCSKPYYIYFEDRPFSGITVAQRTHPYCAIWRISTNEGRNYVKCATDGRAGVSSCNDIKFMRYKTKTYSQIGCEELSKGRDCSNDNLYSDIPIMRRDISLDALPVWGYHC